MRDEGSVSNATIRDVAREASVSVASVSRVMNGHDNVRPALRQRVEDAATALGYVPHAGARNLSMARANAIGVVLPDIHGEFFSELLRGMDREASAKGFQLLLSNIHADPVHAVATLKTMRGRVDGLVVMAPHIDADLLMAELPPGLPVVLINCADHPGRRAELRIDNVAAAGAVVDHLVASGRTRIVHLAGPQDNVDARDRCEGYRAAVARHQLPARVIDGDFMEEAGSAAADTLIARRDGADALFAANDMMAIGALIALRRGGIDVPRDIAIVGFDDIPLARLISPALTTMRVDIMTMGERALTRLVALIDGGSDDAMESTVPHLIIRETSDPITIKRITKEQRGTS